MTNCAMNVLRSIWSFILGSIRAIFFFGCLLFLLIQLLLVLVLVSRNSNDIKLSLPGSEPSSSDYLFVFSGLMLSILGCYGAFYKHHASVKAYTFLSATVTALIIISVLYLVKTDYYPKENEKFFSEMKDMMKDYDMSGIGYNRATTRWDNLQKLVCCGIEGPGDWMKSRGSIPPSCCVPKPLTVLMSSLRFEFSSKCESDTVLIRTGCNERIVAIETVSIAVYFFYIALQLILCLMAFVLGTCQINATNKPVSPNTSVTPGNSQYQRFDGSVYVRQPPVNEAFQTVEEKRPKSYYPDARQVEQGKFSAPPPEYDA